MRKQTKKSKDKDINGHKLKERLKSTQEEPIFDQEMEEEIERIKQLPPDEFTRMFEKMLVRTSEVMLNESRGQFAMPCIHSLDRGKYRGYQASAWCVVF